MKCLVCEGSLEPINENSLPIKDKYECSVCRKKWLIGPLGTKELWRHIGGGTMIAKDDPYPSDDSYKREEKVVTITSTVNQHFKMPFQVESLKELLLLEGISPESRKELEGLIDKTSD